MSVVSANSHIIGGVGWVLCITPVTYSVPAKIRSSDSSEMSTARTTDAETRERERKRVIGFLMPHLRHSRVVELRISRAGGTSVSQREIDTFYCVVSNTQSYWFTANFARIVGKKLYSTVKRSSECRCRILDSRIPFWYGCTSSYTPGTGVFNAKHGLINYQLASPFMGMIKQA